MLMHRVWCGWGRRIEMLVPEGESRTAEGGVGG